MASQPAFERRNWTYDDYLHLDDDARYEIIEGVLTLVPAPELPHQDIVRDLGFILWQYVREKGLGIIYHAPVDVILSQHNVVQPDLLFVASERSHILQRRGVVGPPDLAVEVISPSSVVLDRQRKRDLYERFGVREYWIIDPRSLSIEVLVLDKGEYRLLASASGKGIIRSAVVEGFEVDISDLISHTL